MKEKDTNTNRNTNHNNVNVSVNVEHPSKKDLKPNWYTRTIIGAIVTILVALCIYYGKQSLSDHSTDSTQIHDNNVQEESNSSAHPVEPIRAHKNNSPVNPN